MAHSINTTIRSFLLIGLGALAAYATTAGAESQLHQVRGELHKIEYPSVKPDPTIAQNNCPAEAAAYVAAVNALAVAQDEATMAYYAWMNCEYTSRPQNAGAKDLAAAPAHSVLAKD